LKIKELYEEYNFTLNINGKVLSPKEMGLGVERDVTFCSADDTENELGKIKIKYSDDMYVDIKYATGEEFRAVDYIDKAEYYPFFDIYNEVVDYYNEFQNLCKSIYFAIKKHLRCSPILKIDRKSTSSFNIDEFFKPNKGNAE
jgi:hypothetical protein